mgnify:CR=1 FL=1
MSNVYSVGNNRQLIIYNAGSNIFLRVAHFGGLDRPIVLATDYLCGLTECIYNSSLYYSYINQNGSLILKNIMDTANILAIDCNYVQEYSNPKLAICNNTLLLFYLKQNPVSDKPSLHCITPDDNNALPIPLPDIKKPVNSYSVLAYNNFILLCVNEHIYKIEQIGHFKLLAICTADNNSTDNNNADNINSNNNNSNNNDNYIEREKSLTEDFNKKIAACQAKINEQSAVIDSITTQYNELMDIARQYRDEAIKWRSKFI